VIVPKLLKDAVFVDAARLKSLIEGITSVNGCIVAKAPADSRTQDQLTHAIQTVSQTWIGFKIGSVFRIFAHGTSR